MIVNLKDYVSLSLLLYQSMASRINIYSQLLISTIRIADIRNSNY